MHTAMPGIVRSYDPDAQTVEVVPALLRKYVSEDKAISLPVLTDIPVCFPSMGSSWVLFPINPGDTVMLIFSERSLDKWHFGSGQIDPGLPHRFALKDAIAVPGLRPHGARIVRKGDASSLEVQNAGGWVEITSAGKFKLKNASGNELLEVLDEFIVQVSAGIQNDGSGFNITTQGFFAAVRAKLAQLKV